MSVQLPGSGLVAISWTEQIGIHRRAGNNCRGRVKLAVIDHVASFPPVLLDVEGLTSLCRGSGAKGAAQDLPITDCVKPHILQSWS